MNTHDAIVVGGGLVGSAVAYGMAREGLNVALLDESDDAFRASRGNFGLVWVQGKGDGLPRYATWTRLSADLWPQFATELKERTGIDVAYRKPGGIKFCLGEDDVAERRTLLERLSQRAEAPGIRFEMLDRKAVAEALPGIGATVTGGSYSPDDGECNPLFLLRALHQALSGLGSRYLPGRKVTDIRRQGDGAVVTAGGETFHGARVVVAAGNASAALAPLIGLEVPVRPEKGQILVTERCQPFLNMPTHLVRQTGEGTVLFGDSHEDVGFDDRAGAGPTRDIANFARQCFPGLAALVINRVWGCLRIMPRDGFAIYDRSDAVPGAFTVSCHSGVTLAAVHALKLAPWIAEGELPELVAPFSAQRFEVKQAA